MSSNGNFLHVPASALAAPLPSRSGSKRPPPRPVTHRLPPPRAVAHQRPCNRRPGPPQASRGRRPAVLPIAHTARPVHPSVAARRGQRQVAGPRVSGHRRVRVRGGGRGGGVSLTRRGGGGWPRSAWRRGSDTTRPVHPPAHGGGVSDGEKACDAGQTASLALAPPSARADKGNI